MTVWPKPLNNPPFSFPNNGVEIHVWGLWITIAEGQFFPTKKIKVKIREQSEIIFYEEVILLICKIFSNFAEKFARYDPKSQFSENPKGDFLGRKLARILLEYLLIYNHFVTQRHRIKKKVIAIQIFQSFSGSQSIQEIPTICYYCCCW